MKPFTWSCSDSPETECISYDKRLESFRLSLREADRVIVGAGAGMSAAAGLEYGGRRFTDNFGDFISQYAIESMYAGMFYPFGTEEERWAYTARHVRLNRFDNTDATRLYRLLLELIRDKDYFVITTNVDGLFKASGFASEKVFEVQGDYAYMQCANGCHDGLYYDEGLIRKMYGATSGCRVPPQLVPHCPKCGGPMTLHIRKDSYFVEDREWDESHERYIAFLDKAATGRTLLIEIGVGFNTPTIIRFPFERFARMADGATLIRINRDFAGCLRRPRSYIPFTEDIGRIFDDLTLKKDDCPKRD